MIVAEVQQHAGKSWRYKRGCRCVPCREAHRIACKRARSARIRRGREDPSVVPHGTGGYTNWGCRCAVCVADERERVRLRDAREREAGRARKR